MKKRINCFIPFGTSEDTMQTVKELQASELVDKIYLLGSAPGKKCLPDCEWLPYRWALLHKYDENNRSSCKYRLHSVVHQTNSIKVGIICIGTHGASYGEQQEKME